MGKSKEISQDPRKTIVDVHKSGSSLHTAQARRRVLSARDEREKCKSIPEHSRGPCEDAGGNRYKSIYIHSKTSPILT
jgi:hypothetical protein